MACVKQTENGFKVVRLTPQTLEPAILLLGNNLSLH